MTKYSGFTENLQRQQAAAGILLANLGTPDSPTPESVRKFLAEFLSDPRVVESPRLLWWPILHGFILRTRPRRSARLYQKIWAHDVSPLMDIFNKQVTAVQKLLITRVRGPVQIELAMRYGNPSIKAGLEKLRQNNAQRVLIFPLYPQYSSATTGSTFDAVADVLKSWRWVPELRMLNHYHDFAGYTEALAGRIQEHWELNGRGDKLLFSFHGLPEKYSKAGDPYCNQCHETARLVAGKLELVDAQWQVSFQSRFGPREWLKPYTDQTLMAWGQQGIKSVDVICPGFAADCLETLEEVRMLNRENFLHAGGERYSYIPALNDHPAHIGVLVELIIKNCQDWPEFSRE